MTALLSQLSVPESNLATKAATLTVLVSSVTAAGYMIGMIGPSTYQNARQRLDTAYLNASAPVTIPLSNPVYEPLPYDSVFQSEFIPARPAAAGTGSGPQNESAQEVGASATNPR
jgi:hypothetical protein